MRTPGEIQRGGRFALRCIFGAPILLCVLVQLGSAADRLVGSVEQLQQAVTAARPGDSITLRDGEWRDVDIQFTAEGSAKAPITLRAQTPGKAVITGASRLRIGGRHLIVSGLYFRRAYDDDHLIAFRRDSKRLAEDCRLTDCVIEDCNHPTDAGETRWISLYGWRNRVDHCSISGKTGKGTTLVAFIGDTPNEHRIDHNFFGPRKKIGKNGGETIRIGDSETAHLSSKTIVEDNRFEQCDGEAEIISNKSCENTYRRNMLLRCSGALTLRHGHDCLVEANFFLGEQARGTGGVRIIGERHRVLNNYFSDLTGDDHRAALCLMNGIADSPAHGYAPVKQATVAFNTFVNCKETIVIGLADGAKSTVPPAECTMANNLIVSKRPAIILRHDPAGFHWAGNFVQGNIGVAIDGVHLVEDMRLQHTGDLWRLSPGCPAIDAAAPGYEKIAHDIFGAPRGEKTDAGCEEFTRRGDEQPWIKLLEAGARWASPAANNRPTENR